MRGFAPVCPPLETTKTRISTTTLTATKMEEFSRARISKTSLPLSTPKRAPQNRTAPRRLGSLGANACAVVLVVTGVWVDAPRAPRRVPPPLRYPRLG